MVHPFCIIVVGGGGGYGSAIDNSCWSVRRTRYQFLNCMEWVGSSSGVVEFTYGRVIKWAVPCIVLDFGGL